MIGVKGSVSFAVPALDMLISDRRLFLLMLMCVIFRRGAASLLCWFEFELSATWMLLLILATLLLVVASVATRFVLICLFTADPTMLVPV